MMGRSSSLSLLLLISLLLLLSFSHGLGRKVMETSGKEEESAVLSPENDGMSRELDYGDPVPNTDPEYGFLRPPPPASPGVVASPVVPP